MPDITMCKGGGCPFKGNCYRYTASPGNLYQSYFKEPPFKIIKGKPSCKMYWGEQAQYLMEELKSIVSGRYNKKKN